MKNIGIIIGLFFVSLLLVSCYETMDDYAEPKLFSIEGVEEEYNLIALTDILNIKPQITVSTLSDELEYQWSIYVKHNGGGYTRGVKAKVISTEPELNYLIVEKPQTYVLELKVTNLTTKQEIYATTNLNINNEFSTGFYVLKEIDNATDMDLHTLNGTVTDNVIEKIQGQKLPGTPRSLSIFPKYSFINEETAGIDITTTLNIATTETFSIIDISDLHELFNHQTMFYHNQPEKEESLFACFSYYGAHYYSDKGVYFAGYDVVWNKGNSAKWGYTTVIAGDCKPNINIISDLYFNYMFDEKNGRFLIANYNGALYALSETPTTSGVSPNGITDKMLYFGRNKTGSTYIGYALMQDATHPDKRYLYAMTLSTYTQSNPMRSKKEITNLKLNEASLFANNELQSRALYYVANNQVYTYYIEDNKEKVLTLEGFDSGEEITYISNRYWQGGKKDGRFNYLAIATHHNGQYKLYLYTLDAGIPIGSPVHVLKGKGKVVKMQYITPEFTVNIPNYQYSLSY